LSHKPRASFTEDKEDGKNGFLTEGNEDNEALPEFWADAWLKKQLSATASDDIVLGMRCVTIEAEIDHGRVIPKEPEKLPPTGTALLTVLTATDDKRDWDKIIALLGTMQNKVDGLTVERQARAEWDSRANSKPGQAPD
jgi:hypothetical protein